MTNPELKKAFTGKNLFLKKAFTRMHFISLNHGLQTKLIDGAIKIIK